MTVNPEVPLPPLPVIIGMNNPYGGNPKYALYPNPEKSAGYRLYKMLEEAACRRAGASDGVLLLRKQYIDGFDRRNVLSGAWTMARAKKVGALMVQGLVGRKVIILGRGPEAALGLPKTEWFTHSRHEWPRVLADGSHGFDYWTIPHPSGMCREYNRQANRERAGDLLLALYERRAP